MSELVYLLPFLIALALLMLIGSGSDATSYARAGTFPRASADYLARAMRLRSVFVLAVLGALLAYNTVNENMVAMMEFSSPIYVPVTIMAIIRWREARRALRMLAAVDVSVTIARDIVCCESHGQRAVMHANPWLVERSRRHAIPRASL